jgi:integrase
MEGPSNLPESLIQQAQEYVRSSKSEATLKAYRSDWADFTGWCGEHAVQILPASPETVALYLTNLAGDKKISTIQRRVASITAAHKAAGHESPAKTELVRTVLQGIKRTHGAPQSKKTPVRVKNLRQAAEALTTRPIDIRDRAVLLVGYAGGFRRSELAAIDWEQIESTDEGLIITVLRSKTDQEGEGQRKALPYGSRSDTCPVKALSDWVETAAIEGGPIFRRVTKSGKVLPERITDRTIAQIIKKHAHSLRAGLVTDGFAAGVPEAVIMEQTGHRSHAVMTGYRREAELFKQNVAASVGL